MQRRSIAALLGLSYLLLLAAQLNHLLALVHRQRRVAIFTHAWT